MTIEAKTGEGRSSATRHAGHGFLYGANAAYIEDLYAQWAEDPDSVAESWQRFFDGARTTPPRAPPRPPRGPDGAEPGPLTTQNGELVSALDGNWSTAAEPSSARNRRAGRPGALAVRSLRQQAQDSIRAPDDDPRLPHARPPRRQPRSAGHRQARASSPSSIPTTYGFRPKPTWTARSSSTACWA